MGKKRSGVCEGGGGGGLKISHNCDLVTTFISYSDCYEVCTDKELLKFNLTYLHAEQNLLCNTDS